MPTLPPVGVDAIESVRSKEDILCQEVVAESKAGCGLLKLEHMTQHKVSDQSQTRGNQLAQHVLQINWRANKVGTLQINQIK